MDTSSTTVSVPAHLHAALYELNDITGLPDEIASQLNIAIKPELDDSASELRYDLLRRISQWAQSSEGRDILKERGLSSSDYSMIALLAGTVTSPSAKLPPYKPPLTPEEQAILKSKERKAISALINGFLSVIGVGVAGWWAGGSIGMRQDHKALLSVFGAIAVAITEAVLYCIWQWRYDRALQPTHKRSAKRKKIEISSETDPKMEPTPPTSAATGVEQPEEFLRRRHVQAHGDGRDNTESS
ncbi:hypothetical protein M407DRAFT_7813 [Tulasnella calospora MUT 4182]|uniref:Uncharacterized protein n=1 Tax=Tulasnella calospora MUT 4182 TaxID=1051891 RepID=A0A0C3QJU4_9AGAM|nr:hypothetical protein M407DRAFT_7813 [Tulasnella calospora MUT 4182]